MTAAPAPANIARKVFLIATEESGDRLGANLMKVLRQRLGGAVRFEGVGGQSMAREGLASLFPIEELSIMGFSAVVKQLPKLLRLIRETAAAVTQAAPDILVIIDSPDFTHRVARRVRARDPSLPIVDYVSPSVWAWRPGRAGAMRGYVDHVMALLPFEPDGAAQPLAQDLHQVGAEPIARFFRCDQKYPSRHLGRCWLRHHAGRPVTNSFAASAASITACGSTTTVLPATIAIPASWATAAPSTVRGPIVGRSKRKSCPLLGAFINAPRAVLARIRPSARSRATRASKPSVPSISSTPTT